jgi:hypothetical protein
MVSRSAEALQRLKPQELRALWLKAQGHSYSDIGEITGWTYTKVNRCITEGRRSFLARYAGIESGEECRRWAPVLSALVDGEATPEQLADLRPHLRNCAGCRATLKALQDSSAPIAAVLPVPLVLAAGGGLDTVTTLLMRAYEAVAGGLHERAIGSATKVQAAIEASAAGKVAAVAASAAAVAGGGYATVEHVAPRAHRPPAQERAERPDRPRTEPRAPRAAPAVVAPARSPSGAPRGAAPAPAVRARPRPRSKASPEFAPAGRARAASSGSSSSGAVAPQPSPKPAPEFASPAPRSAPSPAPSPEFGP